MIYHRDEERQIFIIIKRKKIIVIITQRYCLMEHWFFYTDEIETKYLYILNYFTTDILNKVTLLNDTKNLIDDSNKYHAFLRRQRSHSSLRIISVFVDV